MPASSHSVELTPTSNKSTSFDEERQQSNTPISVSDGSSVNGEVDEWIFSIKVPTSSSSHNNNDDVDGANEELFELRQLQPPHPSATPTSSFQQPPTKAESGSPSSPQSDNSSGDSNNNKEQESLLRRRASKQAASAASHNSSPLGWSFSSPFWKIQSNFVLQVTYRPGWQAIPEYTQCRVCASRSRSSSTSLSVLKTVGSFCCAGGCGCRMASLTDRVDCYTQTWTTADVVHVERLDSLEVVGVGQCRALVLTLSPLILSLDFPRNAPSHLQDAWEGHLQRAIEASSARANSSSSSNVKAPTVAFCLPLSQIDPPLLWKVQFPGVEGMTDIAVETYSIFDGHLTAEPDPTHIYINGFQSWSFAGSIVRGHEQPQPAMPQVFSRAFNLGGSQPPPADHIVSAATAEACRRSSTDTRSLFTLSSGEGAKEKPAYQSDFFTCITADGPALVERKQNPLRTAMANVRSSHSLSPSPTAVEEEQFPFQKLDETGGPAVLLGWLAQRKQFGVITADRMLHRLAMHASADGSLLLGRGRGGDACRQETDWAYVQLISPHSYDEEPMVHYLHAAAAHNQARPLQNGNLLTGWCSWYFWYNNITENNLRESFTQLAAMRTRVPTNVAVIDDGYMTAWGDWASLKPRKFDSGMESLARDIESNGMRPGIWLAPFTADKHAKITSPGYNPDWVIRNDFGAAANSSNCGKFFYGLDATNPNVRQHAYDAIQRAVHEWGYNVLKIDFLYAACLQGNGKYDLSLSRAQAMHLALSTIRDAAGPNVFLIGCGCPIATAIGFVDGMRISADTGPTWYPAPPLPHWDHGTLPSLRAMIRNSISRAPLGHRWWHNDPDCLMLGESTRLTDFEVASAASIVAMTCGMMLLSDDLTKVPLSRTRILTKIFPMTGSSAVVLDLHSTNDGLPSLLRLWATDKHDVSREEFMNNSGVDGDDHNREATFFARKASFAPDADLPPPNERKRSCLYAPKGLGSWTIVSISNWSDKPAVLHVPPPALLPPPMSGYDEDEADTFLGGNSNRDDHGFHVLAFWSSRYSWLPPVSHQGEHPLSRKLAPHETEIFHVKRVTPEYPQYIGSDLHFSCCNEVLRFEATKHTVNLELKSDYNRVGHVFVFLPIINTSNVKVSANNKKPAEWVAVGNTPRVAENGSPRLQGRVIRIMVVVHAGEDDGKISIEF